MPDSRPNLTPPPEELRDRLSYDQETGVFIWVKPPKCYRIHAGDIAGGINKRGYRAIRFNGRYFLASRLAWWLVHHEWPSEWRMDHINHDTSDDRIINLRLTNASGNGANSISRLNLKGVYKKKSGRFAAQIKVDYKPIHLGTYDTSEQAAAAYDAAALHHFGEFAYCNANRNALA